MTDIITQIHEANGNPEALLALASPEALDAVADKNNVSCYYCAPFVAQKLFGAKEITIETEVQTYAKSTTRTYDLTDNFKAQVALRYYANARRSYEHASSVGFDINEYAIRERVDSSLTRHMVTKLTLSRNA